jgi:hypothetical protein
MYIKQYSDFECIESVDIVIKVIKQVIDAMLLLFLCVVLGICYLSYFIVKDSLELQPWVRIQVRGNQGRWAVGVVGLTTIILIKNCYLLILIV